MKMFFSRAVAVCVLMAAVALPSQAVTTPLLHPLFTNNMVLQRDTSDPVWGWANPGTTITVTVYDQANAVLQTKTATAASDGSWKTTITPTRGLSCFARTSLCPSRPATRRERVPKDPPSTAFHEV